MIPSPLPRRQPVEPTLELGELEEDGNGVGHGASVYVGSLTHFEGARRSKRRPRPRYLGQVPNLPAAFARRTNDDIARFMVARFDIEYPHSPRTRDAGDERPFRAGRAKETFCG